MRLIATGLASLIAVSALGTQLSSLQALDRNFLLLHFRDGQVTFVDNGLGPSAFLSAVTDSANNVVITNGLPLDLAAAGLSTNWRVKSVGDAQYGPAGQPPVAVFRKSKLNGMAERNWSGSDFNYDYTMEHYVYLQLPAPLIQGQTYTLEIAAAIRSDVLASNLVRDVFQNRSEAVHVNLVGYTDTSATVKAADLHHWMGNGGPRDYSGFVGNKVYLYNVVAGASNEVGTVQFWRNNAGEAQGYDFIRAPVWRVDFTGSRAPGIYRLVVEGVGCSQDFEIGPGIYREPLRVSTLGYFYMRIGQNTNAPGLPVPRRPLYIPRGNALAPQGVPAGFRVLKTSMHPWHAQWSSFTSGDGWDAGYSQLQPFLLPGEPENTNAWGGHSDALDWDRHLGHVSSIYDILLPYLIKGGTLTEDDFGLAESGNGIPDILDAARYEVDYWLRLHDADGYASGIFTVDTANNMAGQAAPTGMAAWANAVNCAMLADAFRLSGHASLRNYYQAEAIQAYQFAAALPTADQMLDLKLNAGEATFRGRDLKFTAAAFLYTLTGDTAYEAVVAAESRATTSNSSLVSLNNFNQLYGTAAYLVTPRPVNYAALRDRMRSSVIAEARSVETDYAATRPSRRGTDNTTGYFHTSHNMQRSIVAHAVTTDPTDRQRFLDALTLEAGWGLGRNPANLIQMTTACTALASKRSAEAIYTTGRNDGSPGLHPGHTPYYNLDDWAPAMVMGRPSWMWSKCFPTNNVTTTWPRAELFFNTRFVWAHCEFTPQQTMRGKQALYTYLYALSPAQPPVGGVHALTLNAAGGTITALPTRSLYVDGEPVLLTANPNAGYVFTGWSGALTGTNNPATLVMDGPKTVTANFVALPRYTLTVHNGTGSGSYYPGEIVNLNAATPPAGLRFSRWIGDTAGITAPTLADTTLQMPGGQAVIRAAYEPAPSTPLIIYRDTGGALTGTWTDRGTLSTITGGAAEGTQHYLFDYSATNWWAGFGLNFDAWGANPGSDVSGCLSLALSLNGPTTTGATSGVRLVDKNGLEGPTISVPRSTVYTAREVALSTLKGTGALDLTRIKEIIIALQGVETATGSLSVDNVYFTAPPALTALDAWRQTYFGTTTTNGPAANTADPDGDGQLNLVEYALDGDPLNAASTPRPQVTLTVTRVILSYLRAHADLTYTVETSPSLVPAAWTTAGVIQDTTTPVGGIAQAAIVRSSAATAQFLRLKISVSPP
jgi:endoglucanase